MATSKGEDICDARRPCRVIRIECNEPKTHTKSLYDSLIILRFILYQKFKDLISEFNDMYILAR